MRCKVGDLAFVVGSLRHENNGVIVDVVRQWDSSVSGKLPENGVLYLTATGAAWVVKSKGRKLNNRQFGEHEFSVHLDANLRPIRDQPGEDEMLRIAGLPNKQPEVA